MEILGLAMNPTAKQNLNAFIKSYNVAFPAGLSDRNQFISSRFVKEIGRLGGDVSQFVPPKVHARLMRKFEDG